MKAQENTIKEIIAMTERFKIQSPSSVEAAARNMGITWGPGTTHDELAEVLAGAVVAQRQQSGLLSKEDMTEMIKERAQKKPERKKIAEAEAILKGLLIEYAKETSAAELSDEDEAYYADQIKAAREELKLLKAGKKKIAILVTGSKDATATQMRWVKWALAKVAKKYDPSSHAITLVHGDCAKGVDRYAGCIADHLGMRVHKMPADWKPWGPAGAVDYSAGYKRNALMVKSVVACAADIKVCIGFPMKLDWEAHLKGRAPKQSKGTIDTIVKAQEAGLKTWVVPLSLEEPPESPRVRVRGAGTEARIGAQEADNRLASWTKEACETRYSEKVDAPEGRAVYSVPDTGWEWVRQPNGFYSSYYEGELAERNISWYEVKKWLNPNMWE